MLMRPMKKVSHTPALAMLSSATDVSV